MGTPEFAVASLAKLVESKLQITAVVTAPDKPAGRGLKLTSSPVKNYALSKDIKVLQPLKLKDQEFLKELEALNADLFVVVAFRMLPEVVWQMPPMGTINVHGSLLPQYRGAAPINWAVINGETETGVTTFKLKHDIDTGNILLSATVPISEDETAGELHDKMKEAGASLLLETIQALADDSIREMPQMAEAATLKHAPKIFTDTCKIDWSKNTASVYNLIRGLSPQPGAFTYFDGKILKIYKATHETAMAAIAQGDYITDHKTFMKFATSDGFIYAKEVQLEGRKRMAVEEFLKGIQPRKIN